MSAGSKRYARALFSLASDEEVVEPTGRELAEVAAAFADEPLAILVRDGSIDSTGRCAAVVKIARHLGFSPLITRFLGVVAERNRLSALPSISEQYTRFLDESVGQVRARIVSARKLAAESHRKLLVAFEQATGKKVLAETVIDPDLLGGVIVEIEGRVYDGSVQTQLVAMQKALVG